jgi:hypothetical protein
MIEHLKSYIQGLIIGTVMGLVITLYIISNTF